MNWLKYLIVLVALFVIAWSHHQQTHKNTLKVGVSSEYPPFEYKENGVLKGYDIEMAQALADEMDMNIEFVDMDFYALIPALQTGKVDLVIAELTGTPERKQVIDFSDIYYEVSFALVSQKKHPLKKLEHCASKTIGVQLGSTMEQLAKTIPNAKLVKLSSNAVLIEQLKLGRVDAVLMENVQAFNYVEKNSGLTYTSLGKTGQGYAIGIKKHSPLFDQTQQALKSIKQQTVLEQLNKKYIGD